AGEPSARNTWPCTVPTPTRVRLRVTSWRWLVSATPVARARTLPAPSTAASVYEPVGTMSKRNDPSGRLVVWRNTGPVIWTVMFATGGVPLGADTTRAQLPAGCRCRVTLPQEQQAT